MRYVFAFEEGSKEQKYLLGGKGANLAEMTNLGLPVPPGFTITTDACKAYMAADDQIPAGLIDEVAEALTALEAKMGKQLGDGADPLLVSVRSGAPFSMPGMMDTVLNLGLNDVSVGGLAQQTSNPRFAYDSYRRFVQMFGKIVLDIDGDKFEHALEELREARGVETDPELSADDLAGLVERFKAIVLSEAGIEFPQDPKDQLALAVEAVFRSWNGDRAKIYRKMEKIPDDLGTAVNVQTMVFGNKGDDSGTGVAFTRNPATGENKPYGDFLVNAQGEDVVAGHPRHRAARRDGQRLPREPRRAARPHEPAADALPRHVRHRVHHRAAPPLPAADARRQAHRRSRAADGRRDGRRGARSTSARRSCASSPRSSTSSCTRSSIPRRRTPRSPRASTRRRAPRSGRSTSPPTPPRRTTRPAKPSSSCARRPRPTICTA